MSCLECNHDAVAGSHFCYRCSTRPNREKWTERFIASRPCPSCLARPGQRCLDGFGNPIADPLAHLTRFPPGEPKPLAGGRHS